MTATTIRVQMAQRKDTAADWTAANPILLLGEIGYETDTKKFKIGDGTTNWNSLSYLPIPDGSGNLTITGNLEIGSTGTLTFEGSTVNGFETTLAVTDPTADRTITLPDVTGTVITSGDTGSVTSTMLADGTIVNADINASAEIAVSKLANGTANQVLVTDGTDVSWSDNLTLAGDLTVNGTTTTINTQDLLVEDKNIIIGNVDTPTDLTADGGGITLKGSTDKTINWVDSTDAWTLSENVNIASGKEYRIDGTKVLDATSLGSAVVSSSLTSVGTIGTGVWQGTAIDAAYLDSTIVTTGDTGTVTSTMIADGTIVDGDVNASAAIAGTKISPNFGSQNVVTTGTSTAASFIPTSSSVPTNGFYLPSANNVAISTNGTGRLFVDASGNVGVGESLPTRNLTIKNGSSIVAASLVSNPANIAYLLFGDTDADAQGRVQYDNSADALQLYTNGSERLRIDSSGRLGLGTSSPRSLLNIASSSGSILTLERLGNVSTDEIIGQIDFYSNDTSTLATGAKCNIKAIAENSAGTLTGLSFGTADGATATATEKLRITNDGKVGIGTTSASERLHVSGGNARFEGNYVSFNNNGYIRTDASNELRLQAGSSGITLYDSTNTNERARIDSSGRLLVGTSTAGAQLTVKSAGATLSPIATLGVSGDTTYQSILVTKFDNDTTTSQNFIQFQVNNGGANCGRITANGANTAAFGSTSDIRLKENIEDLPPQLEKILSLRPVEFDYIESEGGGHQIGFIAQEMQEIYPDVVNERGEDDMLMITGWSKTEARLVKALQEAVAKIETLEAKVAALEGV
jgi:hypothetical protein